MSARRATQLAGDRRSSTGRVLLALGCGVLVVGIAACESTEQESANLGKDAAKHTAAPEKLELGAIDRAVHASQVTLLQNSESAAVAVHLTSASPLANVPIALDVRSGSGALLYSNQTAGIEASLQRMQLIGSGGGWWVDDQVLGVKGSAKASVRIGSAGSQQLKGAVPDVSASGVHVGEVGGEQVVSGVLSNRSQVTQTKLPVYAVTLKGSTVTAAGSAIVRSLAAGASKVAFQIFLVGNPAGAKVQVTVAPTAK